MSCINPNNPTFQNILKRVGNPLLAEIEFAKIADEDFIIQNNATFLNVPNIERQKIYENYVNLMDRKREGKAITYEKFNFMFDNLQVFKHKQTYIFGEWDAKNNVFKGRLISSPNIRELFNGLDILLANVDFMASVPGDIGAMLEKKGLYKLNVDKEYNFRGEDMIKNLYFSNEFLVEKIFNKPANKVKTKEVLEYDKFFNYWALIGKLKEAYNNKDFDKLFPLLKEIGIYDYNAYKFFKKIKQGNFNSKDIEAIVNDIIKNSVNNKVAIDKTDLLNNPKIYEELNNDLNKTLATYLSKFGIKTEILADMQDKLGIDSMTHLDILNKVIYVNQNNQQDYPQKAGKLIAYMMQHNPLVTEITSVMQKSSMFRNLSKDELLDAVGDLISQELYKKTNTELPKSLVEAIRNLIRQFFDLLNSVRINRINRNVGIIADNILLQNQSLITSSVFKPGATGRAISKIELEEALKLDPFGNSIVEKMSKRFILTGSITLSEQGTVYRPNENQIHDIDWVSPLSREESMEVFNEMYPNNKYIRNITNEDYQTDTWLIAPDGYQIVNLEIDRSKKVFENGQEVGSTNKILGYDIADRGGNIVSSYISDSDSHTNKDIEAKLIDIFSYPKLTKEKIGSKEITLESGTKLKILNWQNTFKAKLEFGRLKDIWDYNRYIPYENIYQPDVNNNTVASENNAIINFYNSLSDNEKSMLGNLDNLVTEYENIPFDYTEQEFIESLKCKL